MQQPLWKIRTGKFAGWNIDNSVYDVTGKNIGPVANGRVFSVDGGCVGEIYDNRFVGKRLSATYPRNVRTMAYASIGIIHMEDTTGLAIEGWVDPDF
jgi:hypothetical protein